MEKQRDAGSRALIWVASHVMRPPMNSQRAPKSVLFLFVAAAFSFSAISTDKAFSQTPDRSQLTVGNINFNPTSDGVYDANVGLYLRRPNSPQINFNVNIQRVKTLDEVYDKLRATVDHLADELKNAEIEKPH